MDFEGLNVAQLKSLQPSYPFLQSEAALEKFLRDWETAVLPKKSWTHAAHVTVAAYYSFLHPPEVAFQMTKAGILHYNLSVGTQNNEDSGYHETLTRFWSEILVSFIGTRQCASLLEAVRDAVEVFGEDRNLHRLYYSFDVVGNRRARREWIAPDRVPAQSLWNDGPAQNG